MTSESGLSVQLYGTSSLCFDKDDFMKSNFTVDNFVRVHQASGSVGLETLRDDLGVYLKVLRSAMIELINRDYADFVNLSTNLTGLDRLIEALKTPLGQLKEEVLSVQKLLDDAIETSSQDLSRRQTITKQKAELHRLTQISYRLERLEALLASGGDGGIDDMSSNNGQESGDLVDRLASEVNHLNFLVSHCEGHTLLNNFKPRVSKVCQFVESGLERGLREGVMNKDLTLLRRTLRIYASLGSVSHVHTLVRDLIKKALQDVISESALRSDPRGLPGMYNNTLAAINTVCQPLQAVTADHGSDTVRGYSFLEQSAWPEVALALETGTQHIFNPGNPQTFHQHYLETVEFLESFEKLLGTREKISKFREMPEYTNFMDRWNLPVYFQIRYGEIGQVVECAFSTEGCSLSAPSSSSQFSLQCTQVLWDNLQRCYDPTIFLQPLLHRFWKLSLLLLSRYRTWIETTTQTFKSQRSLNPAKPKDTPHSDKVSEKSTHSDKISEISIETPSQEKDAAVCLVHDIQKLADTIPSLYSVSIESHVSYLPKDKLAIIKGELEQQKSKMSQLTHGVSEVIIEVLTASANAPLRQVSDTPRLYRRTNRASPTSHQPYIAATSAKLVNFHTQNAALVDEQVMIGWVSRIFSVVSEHYRSVTYDVLSSVHKMEESLKRLKRARDRGAQGTGEASTGLSDDDKIRLQIALDVQYFGEQIKKLGVNPDSIDSYNSLLNMVTSAKEGKFLP